MPPRLPPTPPSRLPILGGKNNSSVPANRDKSLWPRTRAADRGNMGADTLQRGGGGSTGGEIITRNVTARLRRVALSVREPPPHALAVWR